MLWDALFRAWLNRGGLEWQKPCLRQRNGAFVFYIPLATILDADRLSPSLVSHLQKPAGMIRYGDLSASHMAICTGIVTSGRLLE
jgi:hypothetical protein